MEAAGERCGNATNRALRRRNAQRRRVRGRILRRAVARDCLPATEVQFYLEAIDLSGNIVRMPETAELVEPGRAPVAWTFSLTTPPALAITEICPNNNSVRDESAARPRLSQSPQQRQHSVNMGDVILAKSPLSAASSTFRFPAILTLEPGDEATVFADGDPAESHAPHHPRLKGTISRCWP